MLCESGLAMTGVFVPLNLVGMAGLGQKNTSIPKDKHKKRYGAIRKAIISGNQHAGRLR